jgi:hypothetical protein
MPPQAAGGSLPLTEEKWLERYKKKHLDSGRGGARAGGWGKYHDKPRGRGGCRNGAANSNTSSSHAIRDNECK